jgi:hypothetical protein
MKPSNYKTVLVLLIGCTVLLWLVLLLFSGQPFKLSFATFNELYQAISIDAVIAPFFIKWFWKWSIFRGWLIRVPVLEGVWRGQLESSWIDPKTNKSIPPIPAQLVIHQTLFKTTCTMSTGESKSYSICSTFLFDDDTKEVKLFYGYANWPNITIRERSPIHEGTALLEVQTKPQRALNGSYYTGRKTTGNMSFRFVSKGTPVGLNHSASKDITT